MSILSVEHLTKIYGEGDTAVRAGRRVVYS